MQKVVWVILTFCCIHKLFGKGSSQNISRTRNRNVSLGGNVKPNRPLRGEIRTGNFFIGVTELTKVISRSLTYA